MPTLGVERENMRAVMKKFVAARFCVLSSEMEARKREEKTVKSQINGKNAGPNRCEKLQMPSCIWSLLSRKDNEAAFNGRKRRRLGHPKPAGARRLFPRLLEKPPAEKNMPEVRNFFYYRETACGIMAINELRTKQAAYGRRTSK